MYFNTVTVMGRKNILRPDFLPPIKNTPQTNSLTKEGVFGTWTLSNLEEEKEEPKTIIRQQGGFKELK